jgi:hypothetical protein
MLNRDYDGKGSVEKESSGHNPESSWRQDHLFGDKLPVVK